MKNKTKVTNFKAKNTRKDIKNKKMQRKGTNKCKEQN